MLDAQTAAQRPGAALPPQYQPDARRIHEPHSAEVHHQNARAAGEQGFMDKVKVSSQPGKGTRVVLTKRLDERST